MAIDQLSATFAALADPTRRAILARLASGECSVTELAEPFDMSMPAVSKHLRVLERAGLIARRRRRSGGPAASTPPRLKEVADLGRALPPDLGAAARSAGRLPATSDRRRRRNVMVVSQRRK